MLVAALDGRRVEAGDAERGQRYACPRCARAVTLKRGRIRIAHFAHKPPTDCAWARGETLAHLEAKHLLRSAFAGRGLRAEVEHVVAALPSDRRADVLVWSPGGLRAAVELQHTTIGLEDIEARAFAYARTDIAQIWIPFLTPRVMADAESRAGVGRGDLFIERYPARPFERWVQAMQFGTLWFYEPARRALWRGRFGRHELWAEGGRMYSPEGEELHFGGYAYFSKKWRELTLQGPYPPERIRLTIARRPAWQTERYRLPQCRIVQFVVDGADVPE